MIDLVSNEQEDTSKVEDQSIANIFEVQEEFFFVFGGIGHGSKALKSVEVFDSKREIWRQFESKNEHMVT